MDISLTIFNPSIHDQTERELSDLCMEFSSPT